MKRPVPVVLTVVFLGLLAAIQLLGAVSMSASGVLIRRHGIPGPPTPSPISPALLPILCFGMAVIAVALAVWSVVTLIGLLRSRSWARYSVLVIAGCIALFAGIGTLMMFAMPFMLPHVATQTPTPDPHIMRGIFFFMGTIYAMFTAVGIALLVYYNQAKTRLLFLQNAPISLDPPNTVTGRPRPTAITVISWLSLISGPFCLIYAFLSLPAFLLGFTLYGASAHLLYGTFAIISMAIGYGLLRLRPEAPAALIAWMSFSFLNMFSILTPWGSRNFQAYVEHFNPASQATNPLMSAGMFIAMFVLMAAYFIVLIWLLHRHRAAFTPAPPPPPLPLHPNLLAG